MKLTKLTTAAAVLAIAAVLGTSAHAQTYTSYNEGDLLLGFEQQNGSGGVTANDYIVDLGSVSQILSDTNQTTLNFNISTTDLTTAFTSGWASNTGNKVQWGIIAGGDQFGPITVGSNTLTTNELFATSPGSVKNTSSAASQDNINGYVQTFADDFNSQTATGNGNGNAAIIASNDSIGWSANGGTSGTPSTNAFGGLGNIEESAANGPTNSTLSFYELNASTPSVPGTDLGTFNLNSSGTLTFTPTATPEPSSMALTGMAMTLMTLLVLRRRQALSND